MEVSTTKKGSLWTRNFTIMVVVLTLITLSYMMMNPNIALYVESLGGTATLTGTIGLAWTFVSVCTRLIVGRIIDKKGSRFLGFLLDTGYTGNPGSCLYRRRAELFYMADMV